jgi:dTMP kinase
MKNLFIAIEGIDGSGKSTQIQILKERLEKMGHKVYTTFEPTDGKIGKMIRDIFSGKEVANELVIAALFAADRLQHLTNKDNGILKMLNDGYTVITDRYYLSSYAYHSVHCDMDWVIDSNRMATQLKCPDVNVYVEISPEESMRRITRGRTKTELYETLDNLIKVRDMYEIAMERVKSSEIIVRVNGAQNETEVADEIWSKIQDLIK